LIRTSRKILFTVGLLGACIGTARADTTKPRTGSDGRDLAQRTTDGSSAWNWETRGEFSFYQDSDAVTVFTPAVSGAVSDTLSGWSASGSYLVDVVSAASVDIVSTASPRWQELRHAASLDATYQPGTLGAKLGGSVSSEPDYLSAGGAITGIAELAGKTATLELALTYTRDIAGRKDTPFFVYSLGLDRYGAVASLELVLDRATTFTPTLDLAYESGRQEKPYRYLPLFAADAVARVPAGASPDLVNQLRLPGKVAEHVPDDRVRYAVSGRLAHRFKHSTLVIVDRFYADDWSMLATTTDVRFVFELGRRWSIWPHARAHLQSGVSFWQRAYVGSEQGMALDAPTFRTGDRELGPLWSGTLGPGARWDLGGSDPRSLSAVLELEGTYTRYSDALYIDQRWAGFASLQLEAQFH
jgi:hypothetical protein